MKNLLPLFLLIAASCLAQENSADSVQIKFAKLSIKNSTGEQEVYNSPPTKIVTNSGFMFVTAGSQTGYLSAFELYFREYLVANHDIGFQFFGCNVLGAELNYMLEKNAEIDQAFGTDFIANERVKAKELYIKQTL